MYERDADVGNEGMNPLEQCCESVVIEITLSTCLNKGKLDEHTKVLARYMIRALVCQCVLRLRSVLIFHILISASINTFRVNVETASGHGHGELTKRNISGRCFGTLMSVPRSMATCWMTTKLGIL